MCVGSELCQCYVDGWKAAIDETLRAVRKKPGMMATNGMEKLVDGKVVDMRPVPRRVEKENSDG